MRILYVVSYYRPAHVYGGPVKSISSMCEALAALGTRVSVLTTDANGAHRLNVPLGQRVRVEGVDVFYYPVVSFPPRGFFYSPGLARACTLEMARFDLAILETLWTHAMGPAATACARAGMPYIVPLRGQLLPWALRHRGWKKQLYLLFGGRAYLNCATALQCSDRSEVEALAHLNLRPPAFIMPNGIEAARFAALPQRGSLRRRLGLPDTAPVLLFLGRLHRVKQPEVALDALAGLGRPEIHLVYAGPDEENLEVGLRMRAERLGCLRQVHFVGLLQGAEVLQALADADLLVMPSAMESFGMSAVEAMAAGVPVLVSDSVPMGRWAESAGAGKIVPGTAEAFSEAIGELLAEPEQLKTMGERGHQLAIREFDISAVARRMLEQCQAIATSGRPL